MHPSADTGRVIAGRYRLQAPIGRGAMGVVWHARDQLLDRDVAIKEVQIADTLTEEERATAYRRTLREAKTAARLNHPAVVTVYDVAEDGGRPWIVMQLVSAQSLDQVLATSGPLSPRRAAEMARQLLSALSVAHAAGVMHRDVKPSNVLLGSDDRAVLTDFGIATFQGDPKLTQTGMVMGSPGFTAPERIRGEDASPASDLWSLGATLFAAVEGHGPFEKRGGAITTMAAIINEDAPEAPAAGGLGPVIAALLRREPTDRPDAAAAARMITDVLPLLPGRTPGAPPGYQATVLSAPSRPAPPRPSGQQPPGSRAASTGPPGGVHASAEQTAPTAPQPVQGDAPRYGQPPGPPPPDFSSWYNPSPRSGPAAQPGPGPGRPGSGSSQPGSGSPSRSGSASRQAPGSQPWSAAGYAPDRRQRPGGWWKIAVAALAIIGGAAGAATVVLLHRDHSGSPPTGSQAGSLPPASLQIVNAVNRPARGPLPGGFTRISRPASDRETAGFSIAAPASWKESTSGYQTYLKDPADPHTNILVDLTPHAYPNDMLREARYIESLSIPRFPGYQRIGLAATPIRNTSGSYWKFTWMNNGVEQEAIDLLFVAQTPAGAQSYALYMTAPASKFNQERPVFDEEVETFATVPG